MGRVSQKTKDDLKKFVDEVISRNSRNNSDKFIRSNRPNNSEELDQG